MTTHLEDRVVRGFVLRTELATVSDFVLERCELSGCSLALDSVAGSRLNIVRCVARDSRWRECACGPAIVREGTFSHVECKRVFCYGTVFLECSFEGNCGSLSILPVAVPSNRPSASSLGPLLQENRQLETDARWTIDIRNARFNLFEAYGSALRTIRASDDDLLLDADAVAKLLSLDSANPIASLIKSRIAATSASSAVLSCRGDSTRLAQLRQLKEALGLGSGG
jgi:hypothetical protein